MNPNLNFDNDVWLERLATYTNQPQKKVPRKCGHCQQTGHTLWGCEEVQRLSDQLYLQAMDHLQVQPLGYKLEHFIYSLTTPYLKILYKRICDKTMKKKEVIIYEEIFQKFKEMNLGYEGRAVRRTRIYSDAYRGAQSDGLNQDHGRILQTYLLMLHPAETLELFDKIYGGGGDWIGRQTYLEQRQDMIGLIAHTDMTDNHYSIHCHFSEMDIGYRFQMYQFYLHTPREMPRHIPRAILTVRQDGMVLRMIHGQFNFSKSVDLELLAETVTTENLIDCAICMDAKTSGQHVALNCSHEFCGDCVGKVIGSAVKGSRNIVCPLCRASVTKIVYKSVECLGEMKKMIVA